MTVETPTLFDGPGAFHRDDPSTSRRAATNPANVLRFGTDRFNTLLAFYRHDEGLTADEAGLHAGVTGYNPRRRASDLLRAGYLEPTGGERDGCRVLRITAEGRRALGLEQEAKRGRLQPMSAKRKADLPRRKEVRERVFARDGRCMLAGHRGLVPRRAHLPPPPEVRPVQCLRRRQRRHALRLAQLRDREPT